MIRISSNPDKATKVVYKDKEVQVPGPESIVYVDREMPVYVDRQTLVHTAPVIKEVTTYVDRVIEKEVDLKSLEDKVDSIASRVKSIVDSQNNCIEKILSELEMQRRALVALKQQRDIDRNRRLMLIRRIKKEQMKFNKKFKLAIGIGILVAIASLIRR